MSSDLIAKLEAEERELVLPSFDADRAWALGTAIRAAAPAGAPIVIRVSMADHLLFLSSLPGAVPDNIEWLRRKSAVVMRFHHSSLYMHTLCEMKGVTLFARYNIAATDFASSGGAVPIIIKGTGCVGSAAVSGLTQYEDHDLVVAGLRAILS